MEQTEKENKSIFVERKRVTLAMKLVCTFAMTYYILFFSFWTYIVFNYKTVFAEGYVNNTLNDFVIEHHYTLCLIKWALVTLIVISLLLVFLKKRYGKFLFIQGKVVKMDFGRKRCCIEFEFDEVRRTIWVGYEMVRKDPEG